MQCLRVSSHRCITEPMPMRHHSASRCRGPFCFLAALLIILLTAPSFAYALTPSGSHTTFTRAKVEPQADLVPLVPGNPIERALNGGESHRFTLKLKSNQYLRVTADQRGIDVVVTLFAPDGRKLMEVDTPNGEQGPEILSYITKG